MKLWKCLHCNHMVASHWWWQLCKAKGSTITGLTSMYSLKDNYILTPGQASVCEVLMNIQSMDARRFYMGKNASYLRRAFYSTLYTPDSIPPHWKSKFSQNTLSDIGVAIRHLETWQSAYPNHKQFQALVEKLECSPKECRRMLKLARKALLSSSSSLLKIREIVQTTMQSRKGKFSFKMLQVDVFNKLNQLEIPISNAALYKIIYNEHLKFIRQKIKVEYRIIIQEAVEDLWESIHNPVNEVGDNAYFCQTKHCNEPNSTSPILSICNDLSDLILLPRWQLYAMVRNAWRKKENYNQLDKETRQSINRKLKSLLESKELPEHSQLVTELHEQLPHVSRKLLYEYTLQYLRKKTTDLSEEHLSLLSSFISEVMSQGRTKPNQITNELILFVKEQKSIQVSWPIELISLLCNMHRIQMYYLVLQLVRKNQKRPISQEHQEQVREYVNNFVHEQMQKKKTETHKFLTISLKTYIPTMCDELEKQLPLSRTQVYKLLYNEILKFQRITLTREDKLKIQRIIQKKNQEEGVNNVPSLCDIIGKKFPRIPRAQLYNFIYKEVKKKSRNW